MDSQPVGIDHFGMAADRGKVKSVFPFLDEVLHLATPAVKLDDLVGLRLHCGDNEGEHMNQLVRWLLYFEDNSSGMRPASGLVHEFTEFYRIINLIVFRCPA